MTSIMVRIGTKGQIVIRKNYREILGMKPGSYVQTELVGRGLLIKPQDAEKELQKVRRIREGIRKSLPEGFDSVQAVRAQRE